MTYIIYLSLNLRSLAHQFPSLIPITSSVGLIIYYILYYFVLKSKVASLQQVHDLYYKHHLSCHNWEVMLSRQPCDIAMGR